MSRFRLEMSGSNAWIIGFERNYFFRGSAMGAVMGGGSGSAEPSARGSDPA
jgi:hypothetical protein